MESGTTSSKNSVRSMLVGVACGGAGPVLIVYNFTVTLSFALQSIIYLSVYHLSIYLCTYNPSTLSLLFLSTDNTTATAHVCCSADQLRTLRSNIGQAQSLINRCPACLSNFIQHYCVVTCDPNSSQFMDADTDPSKEYVEDITVYITHHYADDLYNSCANVQFAGGGAGVMSLLCGSAQCNASAFLKFQGNPNANGASPFLIKYDIANNTTPNTTTKIVHLNDTGIRRFYMCNETVPHKGTCSCSDCPITCPPPPTFSEKHLPFEIIAWSIGCTGLFISTVIFVAAFTASLYLWSFCRSKSGYKRIDSNGSPPPQTGGRQSYGSTPSNDKESSPTNSSLNSDREEEDENFTAENLSALGRCCQIGHYVERTIKLVFYHWGRFVAKFWFLVILVAVVIAGTLSFGLFFFAVTTDPVKLWSSPHSRARLEKNYYDENFRPFYRTEQILVKAKPFVQPFNISPVGTVGDVWTFGAVFNESVLNEVSVSRSHSLVF